MQLATMTSLYKLGYNELGRDSVAPQGNSALEFLERACQLFYGLSAGGKPMRCPYCSELIAELWQPLYPITDSGGNALQRPTDGMPKDQGFEIEIRWMVCHNESCRRLIVQV